MTVVVVEDNMTVVVVVVVVAVEEYMKVVVVAVEEYMKVVVVAEEYMKVVVVAEEQMKAVVVVVVLVPVLVENILAERQEWNEPLFWQEEHSLFLDYSQLEFWHILQNRNIYITTMM